MITDIVVQLEDGSIANVEIQKIGYTFPGQRVGIGLLQEYLFISLDIFCDLLEYLSQRAVISEVFCDGVG